MHPIQPVSKPLRPEFERLLEVHDKDAPHVVTHPFFIDVDEEITIFLRQD